MRLAKDWQASRAIEADLKKFERLNEELAQNLIEPKMGKELLEGKHRMCAAKR